MIERRTRGEVFRTLMLALIGAVLFVRLLTPAGFMPAFDGGGVTIVACPDAVGGIVPAARHHDHHPGKSVHSPCPYAAGAAAGVAPELAWPLAVLLVFGGLVVTGRTYRLLERQRRHVRPPLRGPPHPRVTISH